MNGYRALNIGRLCNAGREFHGAAKDPLVGRQLLHGLPFLIGGGRKCFIGFNGSKGLTKSVTIPVGARARYVIVAHALLESKIMDGEPVGTRIADYVFRLADGRKLTVPIRERFEIGSLPLQWGQRPFLAVPDQKDKLHARHEGPYGTQGYRQTEAGAGWPHTFYLWAWENPAPGEGIVSLTVEPRGRKFVVGAVTLSQLDEYPFSTAVRRDVKITLPRKADAEKPFKLEVEVDRGVATYPYPLPAEPPTRFLRDAMKGWGQERNGRSSPAYVRIAASPSATVTVKSDGKALGRANWGELEKKRRIRCPRAQLEILDGGRNWVHTTVLDAQTGKPTPCRIHFRSLAGVPYQPHGHHDHVNSDLGTWHIDVGGDLRLGQMSYAYIDGTCQGWLPRGKVIVDIGKGYEYEAVRQVVEIGPAQRELVLRLSRWTDMNAARWFSGDTHVHFLGERGAHREASGEGVNVVNLLASQWGHLFTNTEDFTGRPAVSGDGRTIVYCSQENRQHILGHMSLLGLKSHVAPWCSDGPDEAEMGGTMETTLAHWADACHAQGGTVIIPHMPNPNAELAALIATGRADGLEMTGHARYSHLEYYRYLNCGYRLPLAGGTDKMDSGVPVGLCRTYVHIPPEEEFSYEHWCRNLRLGRTFISSGPLLRFSVNGAAIGDTVFLRGNGGTVEIEAAVDSMFPVHVLQVVQEGNVVASTEEGRGARTLRVKASVNVSRNTWFAARCAGPKYEPRPHHDCWRRGIFAHTSPVYVALGSEWTMFDPGTCQYMLTLIDGSLAHIRRHARRDEHDAQVTHHHGEGDHLAFLERPFREAIAAIHKRLHAAQVPH
ncbi:MAG: CehA/McbA family metallohydrolase [Planctomycetota bacterium]|nr:CehA/McbA family metallohydrolase [Planctomycetota bacterium]